MKSQKQKQQQQKTCCEILKFLSLCTFFLFVLDLIITTGSNYYVDHHTTLQDDIELSKEPANQICNSGICYKKDHPMQRLVDETCRSLLVHVDSPERETYPWDFQVIRANTSNAFTFGGGRIFFHDDLLDEPMNATKLEVAGVCAHEIGHVIKRHPIKTKRRLSSVVFIDFIMGGAWFYKSNDDNKILTGIFTLQMQKLFALRHSRHDESESDEYAVNLMYKSNYSPKGLVSFFDKLISTFELEGEANDWEEWVRTHPLSRNRINNVLRLIDDHEMEGKGFFSHMIRFLWKHEFLLLSFIFCGIGFIFWKRRKKNNQGGLLPLYQNKTHGS